MAFQESLRKFDVELVFEREHQIDAGVTRETGGVKVVEAGKAGDVDPQPTVPGQEATDSCVDIGNR